MHTSISLLQTVIPNAFISLASELLEYVVLNWQVSLVTNTEILDRLIVAQSKS